MQLISSIGFGAASSATEYLTLIMTANVANDDANNATLGGVLTSAAGGAVGGGLSGLGGGFIGNLWGKLHQPVGVNVPSKVVSERLSQIEEPGQQVGSALVSLIRQKAGFADDGVPRIIDSNSMRRGMAESLRLAGYNARTVNDIFGMDPGDPAIASLARTIGGRILINNMEDFGRIIAIRIDPRATTIQSWVRLIQDRLQ